MVLQSGGALTDIRQDRAPIVFRGDAIHHYLQLGDASCAFLVGHWVRIRRLFHFNPHMCLIAAPMRSSPARSSTQLIQPPGSVSPSMKPALYRASYSSQNHMLLPKGRLPLNDSVSSQTVNNKTPRYSRIVLAPASLSSIGVARTCSGVGFILLFFRDWHTENRFYKLRR